MAYTHLCVCCVWTYVSFKVLLPNRLLWKPVTVRLFKDITFWGRPINLLKLNFYSGTSNRNGPIQSYISYAETSVFPRVLSRGGEKILPWGKIKICLPAWNMSTVKLQLCLCVSLRTFVYLFLLSLTYKLMNQFLKYCASRTLSWIRYNIRCGANARARSRIYKLCQTNNNNIFSILHTPMYLRYFI